MTSRDHRNRDVARCHTQGTGWVYQTQRAAGRSLAKSKDRWSRRLWPASSLSVGDRFHEGRSQNSKLLCGEKDVQRNATSAYEKSAFSHTQEERNPIRARAQEHADLGTPRGLALHQIKRPTYIQSQTGRQAAGRDEAQEEMWARYLLSVLLRVKSLVQRVHCASWRVVASKNAIFLCRTGGPLCHLESSDGFFDPGTSLPHIPDLARFGKVDSSGHEVLTSRGNGHAINFSLGWRLRSI